MIKIAKILLRALLRLLYRVEVTGMQNYHDSGNRVLIIANHTSLLDGILLYAWLPETPTFAINTQIAQRKVFKPFFKFVDLFLMDPVKPLSIKSMIRFIQQDHKAVIFPEGRITITGSLMKIYDGTAVVADHSKAMILPISIEGAQFSPLSYMKGKGRIIWFPKIYIRILKPEKIRIDESIHGHQRRKFATLQLQDIMYRIRYSSFNTRTTILNALITSARRFGWSSQVTEDVSCTRLNYRDLFLRAVFIGRWIKLNHPANSRIGIMLPNVCATVFTFLAIHYARCIPAMTNYTVGSQIIIRCCKTAGIDTIITSHKFIENARLENLCKEIETSINLVYLEDLILQAGLFDKFRAYFAQLLLHWHAPVFTKDTPDQPAVILFTSGSEGSPKGVVLSHANLLANNAQVCCHIDFQVSDKVFTCLPLFHSFGLSVGCLAPLLNGSKIFLYPTPLHYRIIPELIYESGSTILFSTNTFLRGYARYAHPYDFFKLRYVVAGAEKLHDEIFSLWLEKYGIRILQGYGVTETSPVISVNTPMQHKTGSVGRPMSHIECYLQPIEGIDTGGRLLVRGPNIMMGYLRENDPEIKRPKTVKGDDWHDTGDIADIDEHGYITILGRAKRFAKIGGEMVSLSAVEEMALLTWPGYNHAVVSLQDEKKGERLILVTENPHSSRKDLQEYARNNGIGELYVPKTILKIDRLPLLGSGKTDYTSVIELVTTRDNSDPGWLGKISHIMSHD